MEAKRVVRLPLTAGDENLVAMPRRGGYDDSVVVMPEMRRYRDATRVRRPGLRGLGEELSPLVASLLPDVLKKQIAASQQAAAKAKTAAAKGVTAEAAAEVGKAAEARKASVTKSLAEGSKLPSWVMPVAIGAAVLLVGGVVFAALKK